MEKQDLFSNVFVVRLGKTEQPLSYKKLINGITIIDNSNIQIKLKYFVPLIEKFCVTVGIILFVHKYSYSVFLNKYFKSHKKSYIYRWKI